MMPQLPQRTDDERRLLRLFKRLGEEERRMLLRFGEFLLTAEEPSPPAEPLVPRAIPRPDRETVVAAMKRLSQQYFMLDPAVLLNEASNLLAGHVINGQPPRDVIDALEALFLRHYERYREEQTPEHRSTG